ncbi:MAG: efflux RND transporter periplasmic adaptor subunit [Candidatus Omnitrophica bacterium]|nr:efflux RND transporter periplasmic adaptor subunit [Candidatus Omnitrophota bacterium]
MNKNHIYIFCCLTVLMVCVATMPVIYAQGHQGPEVEVGNTRCPVSGEDVYSMGGPVKHAYNGKIYHLCCLMCQAEFKSRPDHFANIAEQETPPEKAERPEERKGVHHEEVINVQKSEPEEEISHYTCGMHPSVNVTVENYHQGDTKCPICFMPLTPVIRSGSADNMDNEHVVSQVSIKANELKLAGVKTQPVQKRQLFKEIRSVGSVAYDPQLVIAQEEFVSAVKAYEKAVHGGLQEIMERSNQMVESSKRKLLLMGLNEQQIANIQKNRKVQENLILPGEHMWIYGDVYEYELNWIKEGSHVVVKPVGMAGEEFYGQVISINPVVDPRTRSVRFRAMVENVQNKLKPEMYVDIEVLSPLLGHDGEEGVLSIPKSAFLDTGRRKIVWVAKDNGQFEGRKVVLGPEAVGHSNQIAKYYPVMEGLKEGELVVTKGNFLIDSQSQITGIASSAFGGSLVDHKEMKSEASKMGHVHE